MVIRIERDELRGVWTLDVEGRPELYAEGSRPESIDHESCQPEHLLDVLRVDSRRFDGTRITRASHRSFGCEPRESDSRSRMRMVI